MKSILIVVTEKAGVRKISCTVSEETNPHEVAGILEAAKLSHLWKSSEIAQATMQQGFFNEEPKPEEPKP